MRVLLSVLRAIVFNVSIVRAVTRAASEEELDPKEEEVDFGTRRATPKIHFLIYNKFKQLCLRLATFQSTSPSHAWQSTHRLQPPFAPNLPRACSESAKAPRLAAALQGERAFLLGPLYWKLPIGIFLLESP